MFTYDEYRDVCDSYGVGLNDSLNNAARDSSVYGNIYTPSPTLAAVANAGKLVRVPKPRALSVEPFPEEAFEIEDIGMHSLVAIVNASHSRVTRPRPLPADSFHFKHVIKRDVRDINTCARADNYFYKTITDIATDYRGSETGYHIIRKGVTPILLTKYRGEPSSLSLVDMVINGFPFPRGSLFRADIALRAFGAGAVREGATRFAVYSGAAEILPHTAIARLTFLRLSALCLPSGERGRFKSGKPRLSNVDETVRDTLTIDDIRRQLAELIKANPARRRR